MDRRFIANNPCTIALSAPAANAVSAATDALALELDNIAAHHPVFKLYFWICCMVKKLLAVNEMCIGRFEIFRIRYLNWNLIAINSILITIVATFVLDTDVLTVASKQQ